MSKKRTQTPPQAQPKTRRQLKYPVFSLTREPHSPALSGGDRFEVFDLVLDGRLTKMGLDVRFAVRDTKTAEIHRNLMAIVGDCPVITLVQPAHTMQWASLENPGSSVSMPGHGATSFTFQDSQSILRQLINELVQVVGCLVLSIPALACAIDDGQLVPLELA